MKKYNYILGKLGYKLQTKLHIFIEIKKSFFIINHRLKYYFHHFIIKVITTLKTNEQDGD